MQSETDTANERIRDLETRVNQLERLFEELSRMDALTEPRELADIDDSVDVSDFVDEEHEYSYRKLAMDYIKNYEQAYGDAIATAAVVEALTEEGCTDEEAWKLIYELLQNGALYEPEDGYVKVV